jgi:hypothetical protein
MLTNNLDLIKVSNNKLFGFNEIKLECTTIDGIQDEAAFLFTRLTTLRIKDYQNENALNIKKIIEDFQTVSQLDFIALELSFSYYPNLEIMDRRLLTQIKSITLGYHPTDIESLENILLCGGKINVEGHQASATALSGLTKLDLDKCKIVNIDLRFLADYFPQLENLRIAPNTFETPVMLSNINISFSKMKCMRVLKLENMAVQSFETLDGSYVPLLEELFIQFADDKHSLTRVDSFPHFPQLTKLKLYLKGVKWIHPKAFDHFTQLIRFEIHCKQLEDDTFETGVAARFMSFHVACKVLKLTSSSISNAGEIELINSDYEKTTWLETRVALSGLKRLTLSNWADMDLPFHQMMNLEYLSVETSDSGIIITGKLKCLTKLRVFKVKSIKLANDNNSSMCFLIKKIF